MPLDLVTIEQGPHPEVLQHEAASVQLPLSEEDKHFVEALKEKFLEIHGVGLAAPQVGVAKKIIVYGISEDAAYIRKDAVVVPPTVLINPNYLPTEDAEIFHDWEGCFSVATQTGKVPRYTKIKYTAYLPDGTYIDEVASGFTARVLQHEIDHVYGKIITDRLTDNCVQGSPTEMAKIRFLELTVDQLTRILEMIENDKMSVPANTDRYQAMQSSQALIEEIIKQKS